MMLQTISLYFSALFPPSKKFYCIAADGFDCACFRETRTEQECSVLRHRSRMRVTVSRTMQWISKRPRVRKNIEILFLQHLFTLTQRRTSKMLTLFVCHYLRYEKIHCAYRHTRPYMALSRTEHTLYNCIVSCNLLMDYFCYISRDFRKVSPQTSRCILTI